jgi:hypothetical protein
MATGSGKVDSSSRFRTMRTLRRNPPRPGLGLEMFRTCIPCQADLVELALVLHLETEVE